MDDSERRARGIALREEIFGAAATAQAGAMPEASQEYQDLVARVVWGDIWQRPDLDRRTRSVVTVSVLAALHHDDELRAHVRGALHNGLTRAEIIEILMQVGVYAGIPTGRRAFRIASSVLDAEVGEPKVQNQDEVASMPTETSDNHRP